MKKIIAVIAVLVFLLMPAFAQMDVPASLQVALFYKIFDFDLSLSEISGQKVMIGVFYNPQDVESVKATQEIMFNFYKLGGAKIAGKNAVIKDVTSLQELKGLHILYIAPGCDAIIKDIVNMCYNNKILSISGFEPYARQGVAITLKSENEKPKIVINKASVQSSAVNLSSKLWVLAQVI